MAYGRVFFLLTFVVSLPISFFHLHILHLESIVAAICSRYTSSFIFRMIYIFMRFFFFIHSKCRMKEAFISTVSKKNNNILFRYNVWMKVPATRIQPSKNRNGTAGVHGARYDIFIIAYICDIFILMVGCKNNVDCTKVIYTLPHTCTHTHRPAVYLQCINTHSFTYKQTNPYVHYIKNGCIASV